MSDTPLGQIVRIRSEKDKNVIKNFSNYEKRIRAEWAAYQSEQMMRATQQEKMQAADYFDKMFAKMFGGD